MKKHKRKPLDFPDIVKICWCAYCMSQIHNRFENQRYAGLILRLQKEMEELGDVVEPEDT